MKLTLFFVLLLSASELYAQSFQLKGYDIDTLHQEWTAMAGEAGDLLISTVDQPHPTFNPLGMSVGNVRLRFYKTWHPGAGGPIADTTHIFKGNARVNSIIAVGNNFYILAGGFADTLILGQDTLVNDDPFAFDPFVFMVNRLGQVIWVWSDHRPQNNFIHRLRESYMHNHQLLIAGLADDVSGWLASIDPQTGVLLWEEIVTGARSIADAQIMMTQNDTSLFVTGSCENDAMPFGLQALTSFPVTGYQNFLYRRDLTNQIGEIIKTVSHNTFDFESVITTNYDLLWVTPYVSDTLNHGFLHISVPFQYDNVLNTYDEEFPTILFHHGIFSNVTNSQMGFMFPPKEYAIYRPENGPIDQLTIHDHRYGFPSTYINLGINTHKAWLGHYQWGYQLWMAGMVGSQLSYTTYAGGPSGTINFNNISNLAPRWVLLGRDEYISVAEHQRRLEFEVYPNPVQHGQLTLKLSENQMGSANWKLLDIQGRLLLYGETINTEQEIDLTALNSGIYMLEVTTDNKKGVKKVIIP